MPPAGTKVMMIVLWVDEIRTAAQAVKRMYELPEGTSQAEWQAHVQAAMEACEVALRGADADDATLLLSMKPAPLLHPGPGPAPAGEIGSMDADR